MDFMKISFLEFSDGKSTTWGIEKGIVGYFWVVLKHTYTTVAIKHSTWTSR
jgi:hypothetical protein